MGKGEVWKQEKIQELEEKETNIGRTRREEEEWGWKREPGEPGEEKVGEEETEGDY